VGPVVSALRQAYAGRRVFVTGDTGFKGSWLGVALTELGAEVHGYALPPERECDHFRVARLHELFAHRDADLRDAAALAQAVRDVEPEVVFHLAAQPLVRASYEDPKRTFDTNVGGSVNVLEAVRATPAVRALVYVTSDKCYRNQEWVWGYRENDPLGGVDPYSASKAAAELVFASYLEAFFRRRDGFGAASVRAGNVIGGGDWSPHRIVPDCVRALSSGREVVLRNPSATRPWQHVLEPVFGYLHLGSQLLRDPARFSGSWNFGPRAEATRPVRELAERVAALWGPPGHVRVEREPSAPHEAGMLQLNCDKARQLLGWEATWDFERAVGATVAWYKSTADGESALEVTRAQIRAYLTDARWQVPGAAGD
jgi:CDP-glucose 4,6-dehydratase